MTDQPDTQATLKRCPFCKHPESKDFYIRDGREQVCLECRASVHSYNGDPKTALEKWQSRPIEDGLREALIAYRKAQRRMLEKWADGDENVKGNLWKALHSCEDLAETALKEDAK